MESLSGNKETKERKTIEKKFLSHFPLKTFHFSSFDAFHKNPFYSCLSFKPTFFKVAFEPFSVDDHNYTLTIMY